MSYWAVPTAREVTGRNAFRLMPDDALVSRPASGRIEPVAGGFALLARYEWEHPDDGPQSGVLLIGAPEDDGSVHATWFDAWHQKPGPLLLAGTASAGRSCALAATYAGDWGWQIDLDLSDGLAMTMRNVFPASGVPADAPDDVRPGSYDVMVMTLDTAPETTEM